MDKNYASSAKKSIISSRPPGILKLLVQIQLEGKPLFKALTWCPKTEMLLNHTLQDSMH